MITVHLKLAMICFLQQCYPALVGESTPKGEFTIQRRMVLADGYGGDVLQFLEDEKYIYAIHRVWTKIPRERRAQRLASDRVEDRRGVTKGCINVTPEVYEKLLESKATKLVITD